MSRLGGAFLALGMLILSLIFLSWSGLISLPSGLGAANSFPHLKTLQLNRKANKELTAQNFGSAFETYVKALEFDPFAPEIHLDLGLTLEGQQQPDKALTAYENAYKFAKDKELQFMALFNQAQALGKAKKIDEALELYQKALDLVPTSKEAKTNIELMIQSQQQQQGQGGENQEQQKDDQQQNSEDSKDQKNKDPKDQKDPKKEQQKDQQKDPKDQKDPQDKEQDQKDKGKKNKDENRQYAPNQKPQPKPFNGKELSEGDVKKILGEIKQQEQKIRSEYNRKDVKEEPRDKDW